MSDHLLKMALVVALTQGYRTIARKVGPRWGGLAAGLPCTSAVALVGSGCDRGVEFALSMAEMSLLGLVGAATLPLAFARAASLGWPIAGVVASAVAAYLAATTAAGLLSPPGGGGGTLAISALAVLTAATLATRIEVPAGLARPRARGPSAVRTWALRTSIPVGCLLAALGLGEMLGPAGAALMSTFPGVTLTFLLLTHLEAGPASAARLARAFPPGNLGMVAFFAAFRFGALRFGLGWGTALGYLAALGALAIVARFGVPRLEARLRRPSRPGPVILYPPAWPRTGRRFLPLVESIAA